jgi:hypothetical protein
MAPRSKKKDSHKVWGPQTNDLVLQLRKRRISRVILGGMLANMCVESHLRELLEQGFEVAIVKDATAGPRHPAWGDGYQAAMINYRFLAHAFLSTTKPSIACVKQSTRMGRSGASDCQCVGIRLFLHSAGRRAAEHHMFQAAKMDSKLGASLPLRKRCRSLYIH